MGLVIGNSRVSHCAPSGLTVRAVGSLVVLPGSFVKRVCQIPYHYWDRLCPGQIQGWVIRKSPRVCADIVATIVAADAGDNGELPTAIVNLSGHGACIKTHQPLSENQQTILLSFSVNFSSQTAHLAARGVVRHAFRDDREDGGKAAIFNYGVQFLHLPPNNRSILQSLIYQQKVELP